MDKQSDDFRDCNIKDDFSFGFQISPAYEALASKDELQKFRATADKKLLEKFGVGLTGFAFPLAFQSNENQQLVGILTCRHLFYDWSRETSKDEQDPTEEFEFFEVNDGFPEERAFGKTLSTKVVSARVVMKINVEGEKKFRDGGLDYVLLPIPQGLHKKINFCKVSSFDEIKAMKETQAAQSTEKNLQIPCGLSMLQINSSEEGNTEENIPTHAAGFLVERHKTVEKSLEHDIEGIPGMSGTPIFSREVKDRGLADVRLVGMVDHLERSAEKIQYYGKYIYGIIEDIKKKITAIQKTGGENTVIEQFVFKPETESEEEFIYHRSEDVQSYPLWVVGTPCKADPKIQANKVEQLEEENSLLKSMLKEKENKIIEDGEEILRLKSELDEMKIWSEECKRLVPEENKKYLTKMPEDVFPETDTFQKLDINEAGTVVGPSLIHNTESVFPIPEAM